MTLVIPTATVSFVAQLCAAGEWMRFQRLANVSHALAALVALPSSWIGSMPVSRCPTIAWARSPVPRLRPPRVAGW